MVERDNQEVQIRSCVSTDLDAVVRVHLRAAMTGFMGIFPPTSAPPTLDSLRPRWSELLCDADASVAVAEAGECVVGCVVVRSDTTVPAKMLLDRLYVVPEFWGVGIGSRLHDAALEAAQRRGATRLDLWVLKANRRARSMYERRGWQRIPGWILPNDPPEVVDVLYERSVV